jgi:hypothetical protein
MPLLALTFSPNGLIDTEARLTALVSIKGQVVRHWSIQSIRLTGLILLAIPLEEFGIIDKRRSF